MDVGKVLFQTMANNVFFHREPKLFFPGAAKSGKISFFSLETKKTTCFYKNCQISKSRGYCPPALRSDAHVHNSVLLCPRRNPLFSLIRNAIFPLLRWNFVLTANISTVRGLRVEKMIRPFPHLPQELDCHVTLTARASHIACVFQSV